MWPYFWWYESLQHVDALHDDEGLEHFHLELEGLHTEVVEVGEGGGEEFPQHLCFLRGALLQPALKKSNTGVTTKSTDIKGYKCQIQAYRQRPAGPEPLVLFFFFCFQVWQTERASCHINFKGDKL